ncbi:hypothetical protein GCM10011515_20810 [Tsuneonella deserti]|uniref:DUF2339 domain-containing protein n=1 Tax=Tsuneonella deserti TaxID=2035528 RepID=A0ABQ1S8V3_9SPHN|nr:DUF2339 domain-containing protein [Tsuneonella deserti]GGE00893.1 hypothetical protein GCM10011515_20810 [Tsuneonella deserti]
MTLITLIFLVGAIAWLWRRVERLEGEVAALRRGPPSRPLPAESAPGAAGEAQVQPRRTDNAPIRRLAAGAARWRPALDFEDLFGRMLPIWAGGVTLAVADFFLVRWSIDAGLLTPLVRVVLAGLFGIVLIAGAETAYRWRDRIADPRVSQALAGAGLATLYAAFYLAGSAYGLIGTTLAFLGLAAVTGAAIGLSYRFGLPSAVLGLVGGFAAPALVGSEQPNVPLLTLYLALVTAGLSLTGRRQDRAWLGIAALAGGLGWGALLVLGGTVRPSDLAVVGIYLVILGAVLPALSRGPDDKPHWAVRVGAAALAAVQLALLVRQGGFGTLEWSLYLMLGAALAWFGWRAPAVREGSAVAAVIAIALLFAWTEPSGQGFSFVCAALAAIFAGVPLAQIARGNGRALDLAQPGGFALGVAATALWHFGVILPERPDPAMALALFALACLAAAAVALASRSGSLGSRWTRADEAVAALLGYGALVQFLPETMLAWTAAAMAVLLAWRAATLAGAIATLLAVCALWGAEPVLGWTSMNAMALAGVPAAATDMPGLGEVVRRLLPGVTALGFVAWRITAFRKIPTLAALGVASGVAAHIAYRAGFASVAGSDFVSTGAMERAGWVALLVAAAWLAMLRGWPRVACAIALAAAAHFAWFSLALHNPLWAPQAVGAVPILNALLPSYAVGIAALLLLRRLAARGEAHLRWTVDAALMLVTALLAISELRQCFSGTILVGTPVGQGEDLLRSLTGIVLAIGFLLWGARSGERSWRIGSLVLMVVAVFKVFLIDAAGLEGLGRVASFMALGFSLIGIGWFYARELRA